MNCGIYFKVKGAIRFLKEDEFDYFFNKTSKLFDIKNEEMSKYEMAITIPNKPKIAFLPHKSLYVGSRNRNPAIVQNKIAFIKLYWNSEQDPFEITLQLAGNIHSFIVS